MMDGKGVNLRVNLKQPETYLPWDYLLKILQRLQA